MTWPFWKTKINDGDHLRIDFACIRFFNIHTLNPAINHVNGSKPGNECEFKLTLSHFKTPCRAEENV